MILMLSGTQDGRELGHAIASKGYKLIMTAVSQYGGEMLPVHPGIEHAVGHLSKLDMIELIKERDILVLIDATHPYASEASENAIAAAAEAGIGYLRYERPNLNTEGVDGIVYFSGYPEAAAWLAERSGHVFLTIGSRRLAPFVEAIELDRLTARVLPTVEVLQQCTELGMKPAQLIAMQGPFSKELNLAMLKRCNAKYLVTKASSTIGGFEDKISAARELGLEIVVIERPHVAYPCICDSNTVCIEKLEALLARNI